MGRPLVAPLGGALNVQDPWHIQLCPVVPVVYDQYAIGVDVSWEHQFLIGDDPLVQVKRVFGKSIKGSPYLRQSTVVLTEVEGVTFAFHCLRSAGVMRV